MNQISQEIIDLFDRTASKPVTVGDRLIVQGRYMRGSLFRDAVKARLPPGAAVLDYGCGRGRIARMIAESGYRVDAMDPSRECLKDAESLDISGLPLRFSVLTGFGDSLPNEAYDGIVCSSVIEFVEDVPSLLRNFRRTLKPGGALMISFANKSSLWRTYAKLRFGRRSAHYAFQKNVWTPPEFMRVLAAAGFDKVRIERYFEPPAVRIPVLSRLASCRFFGTLGFASAARGSSVTMSERSKDGGTD